MLFENLGVLHLAKRHLPPQWVADRALSSLPFSDSPSGIRGSASGSLSPRSVFIDTCQRWVWVVDLSSISQERVRRAIPHSQLYVGKLGYLFLLKLATGLESEIPGETDIFGQVKEAWRLAQVSSPRLFASGSFFPGLFSRLFEDTKEIRTRYVQNWGGANYGSLVRRMIRDFSLRECAPTGPIFLVGAGKIAHSIAPFLTEGELWIWNRNWERLEVLRAELQSRLSPQEWKRVRFLNHDEQALAAWEQARHTVVAIPVDEEQDPARMGAWLKGGRTQRSVIHLGGNRSQCQAWLETCGSRFFALDDCFAAQNSQDQLRAQQLRLAMRACEERAHLRALGDSLSIPHGWEDLACFA